jgi:hypothetical protein
MLSASPTHAGGCVILLNEHLAETTLPFLRMRASLALRAASQRAYQSGRCRVWIKVRNSASIAVQREPE